MIGDLEAALLAQDVDGVRRALDALDAPGLAEARRWAQGLKLERWSPERQVTVRAVVWIRLLTAQQVIDRLRRRAWPREGAPALLDEVLARDPAWRADLVRVVGGLGIPADGIGVTGWDLYPLVRTVSRADGLAIAWGDLLVRGWLDHCFPTTFDDRFRRVAVPGAVERVRAEGQLDPFPLALGHRGLSEFVAFAPTVVTLVDDGDLDRADVVGWCLTALDSPGRPSDQTVLADILVSLDPPSGEVPGGLARLQQLLATCHGSVTSRLLPLAIDLLASPDDVAELAATIGARPEKKQRTDLLRALTTQGTRARLGDQAVRTGLEILAESTDAVLAGKAATALQRLGAATRPAATPAPRLGLWDLMPEDARPPNNPFTELGVFDDNAVAVVRHAALNRPQWNALEPFYEPTALSIVIRWAWHDGVDVVRARLQASGPIDTVGYDDTMLGRLLPDWLDGSIDGDGEPGWWRRYWVKTVVPPSGWTPPEPEFAARHLTESLRRAGRIPFLLSSPTDPTAASTSRSSWTGCGHRRTSASARWTCCRRSCDCVRSTPPVPSSSTTCRACRRTRRPAPRRRCRTRSRTCATPSPRVGSSRPSSPRRVCSRSPGRWTSHPRRSGWPCSRSTRPTSAAASTS